jgi:hypothetical protein
VTLLTNSIEGVTPSGTTLTQGSAGNTGGASGSFFDTITLGTGTTLASDSTQAAHGALSAKFATGATSASVWFQWDASAGTLATAWFRIYMFFTAFPATTLKIFQTLATSTQCGAVSLTTAGKISHSNSANTVIQTGTVAIGLNQWVRLEGFVTGDPSAGQIETKLFNTADSATPDETLTDAATQATNGAFNKNRMGVTVAQANIGPFWFDDVGLSSTGYLGPAVAAAAAPQAIVAPSLAAIQASVW